MSSILVCGDCGNRRDFEAVEVQRITVRVNGHGETIEEYGKGGVAIMDDSLICLECGGAEVRWLEE